MGTKFKPELYTWEPKTLEEAMLQIWTDTRFKEKDDFNSEGKTFADLIQKEFPTGKGLDFGCGIGRILKHLPKERFDGYEPKEGMRKFLTKWMGNSGHKIYSSSKDIPSEKYDFVFEITVFQHIEENEYNDIIGEIKRILRKNSRLLTYSDERNGPLNLESNGFKLLKKKAPFLKIWSR